MQTQEQLPIQRSVGMPRYAVCICRMLRLSACQKQHALSAAVCVYDHIWFEPRFSTGTVCRCSVPPHLRCLQRRRLLRWTRCGRRRRALLPGFELRNLQKDGRPLAAMQQHTRLCSCASKRRCLMYRLQLAANAGDVAPCVHSTHGRGRWS